MKKKLILCATAVLCLALALFFGVVRFSWDNIENRKNGYTNSTLDGLTVLEETQVINGYLNNVRVNGEVAGVFCTTAGGERILPVSIEQKNSDVYYNFDCYVYSVCITGANDADIEINPTNFNINTMLTFFIFVLPLVLTWAIYNIVEDRVAFKKDVTAMKRYKYLLYDLVSRDVKTKYRRSALGVLWSVLNPLLMMLVLTAVFSQIIKIPVEGGFALFYLTGYIIFNFVSESSNFSLVSIINGGSLIKKVYLPKYVFPLEKTIFSLVNMLFSLIAFVIVFALFLIAGQFDLSGTIFAFFFTSQVELSPTMLLFFVPIIYIFVFSLGLNLILSTLNVFFRDIGHLWGVFMTVWMYATPIIYPIDAVPGWLQSIIRFNPLYYYVTYFRDVMIYGTLPSLTDNLICIGFSLMALAIGITVFRKNQDKFILHI